MKVFITGGTGFIGSHTAVALLQAGHQVRLLVRNPQKMRDVFAAHALVIDDYVEGDVTDRELVREAMSGCDAVFHCAGMVATSRKMADKVWRTNVGGTENIVGQAVELGIGHIVHVSSITAMHCTSVKQIDENSALGRAQNAYGRSKIASEKYLRDLQKEGAPITITYPSGVIGPLDPGLSEPLEGLQISLRLFGVVADSGVQFVDVRDCADAHVKMLEQGGGPNRYMLGGIYFSWRELVGILRELTGRPLIAVHFNPFVLRAIGRLADLVSELTGWHLPLSYEATVYATHWCHTDSKKLIDEFEFEFRDGRQSLADTIKSMAKAGHLKPRHVGLLDSGQVISLS